MRAACSRASEPGGWRKGNCGKLAPKICNHKPRHAWSPQKPEEAAKLFLPSVQRECNISTLHIRTATEYTSVGFF